MEEAKLEEEDADDVAVMKSHLQTDAQRVRRRARQRLQRNAAPAVAAGARGACLYLSLFLLFLFSTCYVSLS